MLDLFNIPTPQTANYQEFYGGGTYLGSGVPRTAMSWVKPRGASMVRFLLIGAGGGGGNATGTTGSGGGGSGAVTSWIGPAMFVPDTLIVFAGAGGSATNDGVASSVAPRLGTFSTNILTAAAGYGATLAGAAGGNAMPANQFTACGIFTSIAGQAGTNGSSSGAGTNQAASTTTFLSGGAGGAGADGANGGSVTPNYGYTALASVTGFTAGKNGYFITQPILVGTGGAGGGTTTAFGGAGGRGGIGCGGGGAGEDALTGGGRGGDGAVFIWAW